MPAIISHYLCGLEASRKSDENCKNIISDYPYEFNLGTQGPDIFFFYIGLNSLAGTNINHLGRKMHKDRTARYLQHLMNYASKSEDVDLLSSYIFGFMTHYALDSVMHPYVFYKTGFSDGNAALSGNYVIAHHSFEAAIDVALAEKIEGISFRDIKVHDKVRPDRDSMKIISEMHAYALKETYNVRINRNEIVRSMENLSLVYRLLSDKSGNKKKFISKTEKVLGIDGFVSSLIHLENNAIPKDFIERKEPWYRPWDKVFELDTSVLDLFYKGVCDSLTFFELAYRYIYQGETNIKYVRNRSYITGLSCTEFVEFRYFDKAFSAKLAKASRQSATK